MDQQRQEVFQKLRPSCVELSSVGLQFKAHQVAIKDVLRALDHQNGILQNLSRQNLLDAKLAEYAFFPLTHVFNESQQLSSRCLEVAVQSVEILVSAGWRQCLASEMGKQLLILMTLLAGGDPRKQTNTPTDELKTVAYECIAVVIKWLASGPQSQLIFGDNSTRNIVDKLTYMLTESLSESINDAVQLAAGHAMSELFSNLSDRVFIASLIPRTVSALVKALKPSTQARRTNKVLCSNLALLRLVLSKSLSGDVVAQAQASGKAEAEALDESWLKATSSQVKNALIQVSKLRNHDRADVKETLSELCVMVITECSLSLRESLPVMLETLVILAGEEAASGTSSATVKHIINSQPDLLDILRSSFYDWTQALPRIMQANDDAPKELMIKKIANAFDLISNEMESNDSLINTVTMALLNSVANAVEENRDTRPQIINAPQSSISSLEGPTGAFSSKSYQQVLFSHQSQESSTKQLANWIQQLKHQPCFGRISRNFVDSVPNTEGPQKIAALWLAIELLKKDPSVSFDIEDLILADSSIDKSTSRSYLIHDLYSLTRDLLIESSPFPDQQQDWRLTALSLEVLALQAQQLGKDYRNELYETLYPVLALFSSSNDILRNNAIATLNVLASACKYESARAMLIENVDYLVNSIAWKLNTFNLSPEAPRVLNMVVRLVGSRLMPYLDDLIASIFAALDNYHGYPAWVEILFTVLKTMVDENAKHPTLAITYDQKPRVNYREITYQPCSVPDILENLRTRKKRKLVHGRDVAGEDDAETPRTAPHRPWTREQDDPSFKSAPLDQDDLSLESLLKQDEEGELPAPTTDRANQDEDPMKPQSKSHDLLLKIAQSTVPHLSSPSPRVRHLLLQLLLQISPLLARHEDTFLPLINAVWPAIVPRLFAEQMSSLEQDGQDISDALEYPYNIAAAAELIAALCENAKGFMSSRVEQVFKQLIRLFKQTYAHVEAARRQGKTTRTIDKTSSTLQIPLVPSTPSKSRGNGISGIVDLHIIKQATTPQPQSPTTATKTPMSTSVSTPKPDLSASRSAQSQILTSLVTLLTTVLNSVPLSLDLTDEIIVVLEPFVTSSRSDRVVKALERFNPDILWLVCERARIENEIELGQRPSWDRSWTESQAANTLINSKLATVVF